MLSTEIIAKHSPDQEAWKILFQSFLNGFTTNIDFNIHVDENTITMITSSPLLNLAIQETLGDQQSVRRSLRYTLNEVFESSESQKRVLSNPDIHYQDANALNTLSRIFSSEVLTICGLTPNNMQECDNLQTKTLRIPIPPIHGFDMIAQGQMQVLSAAMIGVGINGMKKAYQKQGPLLEINKEIQSSMLELAPEFQKAFYIEKNDKNNTEFVIDYGVFLNLLFPTIPEFTTKKITNTEYNISVDKKAFLAYLIDNFEEGFILDIVGNTATPVCLPKSKLVKSKSLLSLALDCSSSMNEDFGFLISQVKSFLEEYVSKCESGDIIRIIAFSDEVHEKEFTLTEKVDEDLKALFEHLKLLKADGYTHLYDAVRGEIIGLSAEKYQNYISSAIIFTDGMNDTGEYIISENKKRAHDEDQQFLKEYQETLTQQQERNPSQVLSVFSMGLGDWYNKDMLQKWAELSGVHHTHLRDINDFSHIKDCLDKLRRPRILANFVQREVKPLFSVYEGELAIPSDFALVANEPFTYNGRAYQFEERALRTSNDIDVEDILNPQPSYVPMQNTAQKQDVEPTVDKIATIESLSDMFTACHLK